ncbi:MAG: glycosyltransferase family 2 protein [Candidatus Riflebacteria bacterium]|nr:glycosyltransferase family 2 protein [Candidatus Riflebacteria bacterium]
MTTQLAIVIPVLNEKGNILPLLTALEGILKGISWEVIFVDDDSGDGTAEHVREIALTRPHVRCLQRLGRRGLSSACVEGMLASAAPFLAVMDGDLQHDERLLPCMFEALSREDLDIVVGSRYTVGGGTGDWSRSRMFASRFATYLAHLVVRVELSDPMSGFFMLRRTFLDATMHCLSTKGFKILLDLFASAPAPARFRELPFTFRNRQWGESKLDSLVVWEFLLLLLDKTVGVWFPVHFVMFVLVGLVGALAHIILLGLFLFSCHFTFFTAQAGATVVAMIVNFFLNNAFTHRDQKLKDGELPLGLMIFMLLCSIGAGVNFAVASSLYDNHIPWWFAGVLGAVIGGVLNYAATAHFTWRRNRLH